MEKLGIVIMVEDLKTGERRRREDIPPEEFEKIVEASLLRGIASINCVRRKTA